MRGNQGSRTFTLSCALVFMALLLVISGCTAAKEWGGTLFAGGILAEAAAGTEQDSPDPSPTPSTNPAKPEHSSETPKEEEVPTPPKQVDPLPPLVESDQDHKEEKKLVALTFDDGPDNKYTLEIMDVLKEYEVHATFFVVGLQVEKYPETAKRIIDDGHTIGNHSWSHKDLTKLNHNDREKEIQRTQQAILEATGVTPDLMRAPYGAISKAVLSSIHDESMKHVYWTIDTRDWAGTPVAEMHANVLENINPGAIILLHSFGGRKNAIEQTIELLPSLIEDLREKGYEFVTVEQLIAAEQASSSVVK
jgi:polysaccharide deacetylase family sporulation protein PdaB